MIFNFEWILLSNLSYFMHFNCSMQKYKPPTVLTKKRRKKKAGQCSHFDIWLYEGLKNGIISWLPGTTTRGNGWNHDAVIQWMRRKSIHSIASRRASLYSHIRFSSIRQPISRLTKVKFEVLVLLPSLLIFVKSQEWHFSLCHCGLVG